MSFYKHLWRRGEAHEERLKRLWESVPSSPGEPIPERFIPLLRESLKQIKRIKIQEVYGTAPHNDVLVQSLYEKIIRESSEENSRNLLARFTGPSVRFILLSFPNPVEALSKFFLPNPQKNLNLNVVFPTKNREEISETLGKLNLFSQEEGVKIVKALGSNIQVNMKSSPVAGMNLLYDRASSRITALESMGECVVVLGLMSIKDFNASVLNYEGNTNEGKFDLFVGFSYKDTDGSLLEKYFLIKFYTALLSRFKEASNWSYIYRLAYLGHIFYSVKNNQYASSLFASMHPQFNQVLNKMESSFYSIIKNIKRNSSNPAKVNIDEYTQAFKALLEDLSININRAVQINYPHLFTTEAGKNILYTIERSAMSLEETLRRTIFDKNEDDIYTQDFISQRATALQSSDKYVNKVKFNEYINKVMKISNDRVGIEKILNKSNYNLFYFDVFKKAQPSATLIHDSTPLVFDPDGSSTDRVKINTSHLLPVLNYARNVIQSDQRGLGKFVKTLIGALENSDTIEKSRAQSFLIAINSILVASLFLHGAEVE